MTAVKDSVLYKTLKKAVRKQDHAELLRMLEMAYGSGQRFCLSSDELGGAFIWFHSPQGDDYWRTLSYRLQEAGHDCY